MRQFLLGLGGSALFAAGYMAGTAGLALPKAEAASAVERRWAYFCFDSSSAEDVHTKANAAGVRGWEMASAAPAPSKDGSSIWCFKQPKP
jgi:hypothetical protein